MGAIIFLCAFLTLLCVFVGLFTFLDWSFDYKKKMTYKEYLERF